MAMGARFSKTGDGDGSTSSGSGSSRRPTRINSDLNSKINRDLTSYEAACRTDPDLQAFDSALKERTGHLINTLAAGVDVRSVSLDALRDLTDCLVDVNHEVVHFILQCKEDIWRNRELSELVDEYFKNSFLNLKLCTALDLSLRRARDSLLIVKVALRSFEQEEGNESEGFGKTLRHLREFKAIGDPFTEEFFSLFQSVYKHQKSMLQKLEKRKEKLDKRLESVRTWRKLSYIIFAATFTSVLICSVVVAAFAAPPVVAALVGAASAPLGSVGGWINTLWKKYEKEIEGQSEMNVFMQFGTSITIKDLDSIRLLVDRFEVQMEALLQNADFALVQEEGVVLAMAEINKNMNQFIENIEQLTERSHTFSEYIRKASVVVLKKVIEHPSTR